MATTISRLRAVFQWLAARLPHVEYGKPAWRFDDKSIVFRIYGLKPYYRLCLFDFTRVLGATRIDLLGLRVSWRGRTD
jgi:hypothetical protein